MSSRIKIVYKVFSVVIILATFLLQSHSYALADVETPVTAPPKILKNFSAIGYVSDIDGVLIKIEKANGSDGVKNTNYSFDFSIAKIENQYYESLNILNIKIGDKIIAQGGLDGDYFIAKRVIVFESQKNIIEDNNVVPGGATSTSTSISILDSASSLASTSTSTSTLSPTSSSSTASVSTSTIISGNSDTKPSTTSEDVIEVIASTSTSTINSTSTFISTSTIESASSTVVASTTESISDESDDNNFIPSGTPDPIVDGAPVVGVRDEVEPVVILETEGDLTSPDDSTLIE